MNQECVIGVILTTVNNGVTSVILEKRFMVFNTDINIIVCNNMICTFECY